VAKAPRLGRGDREFESRRPDWINKTPCYYEVFVVYVLGSLVVILHERRFLKYAKHFSIIIDTISSVAS
jgi:hypothetical protein